MQVSNSAGSVTSVSAQLILLRAPAITSAPASAAVVAGASATYSLLASADALRYLWLRNGLPISGAMSGTTSSHTTAVLALADSGAIYSVIVFNGAGAVVSAGATLTVTAPPGLTATTLVSRSTSGAAPNNWSILPSLPSLPSLPAEGQRAAFRSKGTNLVTGTTVNGHVYLRDIAAGTTALINATLSAGESALSVNSLKLAAGGRCAVFSALANDLVAGDTHNVNDVFLRDLRLDSQTTAGAVGNGPSDSQLLSGAGRSLLFRTNALNLTGDSAATVRGYVMVRDRQRRVTIVASRRVNNSAVWIGPNHGIALWRDGSTVAFVANIADVVAAGTAGET